MKKLIAYSSVAHMGYVTMGIFAANQQGVDGAIFQMISHGFVSGALFLCVGVIYDRMHTREIDAYGGLVVRMPVYALIFMLFTMANVGLPGTSGFVGEFLTIVGVFQVNTWVAFVAATGVILSAAYALWLYRRVVLGDLIKESLRTISDMTGRERAIFAPLVVMTLLLGVYPSLATDIIGPSVAALVGQYETALLEAGDTMLAAQGDLSHGHRYRDHPARDLPFRLRHGGAALRRLHDEGRDGVDPRLGHGKEQRRHGVDRKEDLGQQDRDIVYHGSVSLGAVSGKIMSPASSNAVSYCPTRAATDGPMMSVARLG